jgi:hypothetical protein
VSEAAATVVVVWVAGSIYLSVHGEEMADEGESLACNMSTWQRWRTYLFWPGYLARQLYWMARR